MDFAWVSHEELKNLPLSNVFLKMHSVTEEKEIMHILIATVPHFF